MTQQSLFSSVDQFGKVQLFKLVQGSVEPLGANLAENGCNFSVYAPDAAEVFICLFDADEHPLAQVCLEQRVQSKWFGFIENVSDAHLYGIRIRPKQNKRVHQDSSIEKLLIDPYAKSLNRALNWDKDKYRGDSHSLIPKANIVDQSNNGLQPLTLSNNNRVIYEAHVKGISKLHPDVPNHLQGTYLGAAHPSIIAHLKKLGVTSVQFLPLMALMPEPFVVDKGLTNYWGYNPVNFFSPEPRYAYEDALSECKQMIDTYRKAGIEIILDVVFNHTAEGGSDGPVLSFKGLCESHAYLIELYDESDEPQYANYSGCGNTLQVADTFICNMIIDAMRYWVSEMGVSGFRFDLATVLGREPFEYKKSARFFSILQQDPILKQAVMLAEPWDIGPGGYQLGHFPANWLEVNDKYRDTIRGFWRGDKGLKGEFATRLMGSKDIFRKGVRPMYASVNNVSYHDGFTLHDIVSYENKHNKVNLEDNRDGHNHNLTRNYGYEGTTADQEVLAIREQQKRNLFATLILSQGTAHILGGDELSRTQNGNNNAYCQDNSISWYNWQLDSSQQAFLDYCVYVVALRQNYPLLQQMNFADDKYDNKQNILEVYWYRRDGSHKSDIDWVNHEHHCFALHIVGEVEQAGIATKQQWLFCFNSLDKAKEFSLPMLSDKRVANVTDLNNAQTNKHISNLTEPKNAFWQCMLNTACLDVGDYINHAIEPLFEMPARSICVFKK